jgi:hypothetical protein
MAHPLTNPITEWYDPTGHKPDIVIDSDATFTACWQSLRNDYIPRLDYRYSYVGLSSCYLLAGIVYEDTGLFLNISKNNKKRELPLDSSLVSSSYGAPSGLVTTPVGAKQSVTKPILIAKTPLGVVAVQQAISGKTFAQQVFKQVIKSPKQKCENCGGDKTLLLNFWSCDSGCK